MRASGFPSITDSRIAALAAVLRATPLPRFQDETRPAIDRDGMAAAPDLDNALLAAARLQGCVWPLVFAVSSSNPLAGAMRADVQARAEGIAAQMGELNALLSPRHRVVWLKGAANLADQQLRPQRWRQMADLDVLVGRDDLENVSRALVAAGYRPETGAYDERLHPHLPAFHHPDRPAMIEVHSRLLRFREGGLLDPATVLARAEPRETAAGECLVPSRTDRIVHLIAHAQIGSHRHARRQFMMRDALELAYLADAGGIAVGEAVERYERIGKGAACIAFLTAASVVMGHDFVPSGKRREGAERWAQTVFDGWSRPGGGKAWLVLDWIGEAGRTLVSTERLAALSRLVANPALRRDVIAGMGKRMNSD